MTLKDEIIELITKYSGLSDREIADRLRGKSEPQQPINIACRNMEQQGLLRRSKERQLDNLIGNYLNHDIGSSPSVNRQYQKRVQERKTPIMQGLSLAPDSTVSTAFKYFWLELGPLNIGENGKLTFPPAENCPGLYRFRLKSANGERRYIGETVRLAQRFNFYRNPGPTQATNIRVNEILLDHLLSGGQANVDVVFGGVTLKFAEEPRSVDLSDKSTRRLLEHAAIVFEAAFDIESLNR